MAAPFWNCISRWSMRGSLSFMVYPPYASTRPPPVISATLPVGFAALLIDALIGSEILVGDRCQEGVEVVAGRADADAQRVDGHAAELVEPGDGADDVGGTRDFSAEGGAVGEEVNGL